MVRTAATYVDTKKEADKPNFLIWCSVTWTWTPKFTHWQSPDTWTQSRTETPLCDVLSLGLVGHPNSATNRNLIPGHCSDYRKANISPLQSKEDDHDGNEEGDDIDEDDEDPFWVDMNTLRLLVKTIQKKPLSHRLFHLLIDEGCRPHIHIDNWCCLSNWTFGYIKKLMTKIPKEKTL